MGSTGEKVKSLDKFLHTWISAAMVFLIALLFYKLFEFGVWHSVGCAFLITILIGGLKELVWDLALKKGTPSGLDFLADVIGSVMGFLAFMLITGNTNI